RVQFGSQQRNGQFGRRVQPQERAEHGRAVVGGVGGFAADGGRDGLDRDGSGRFADRAQCFGSPAARPAIDVGEQAEEGGNGGGGIGAEDLQRSHNVRARSAIIPRQRLESGDHRRDRFVGV